MTGCAALITGGESGIGAACVTALAGAGMAIGVINHRDAAAGSVAAAAAAGSRAVAFLASAKAAYKTGTTVTTDGALSMLMGQGHEWA